MITTYALLIDLCGLSWREAADFLGVGIETSKRWGNGKKEAPVEVIESLKNLHEKQERAAEEALSLIETEPKLDDIELTLMTNDEEAQERGWPCASAHARVISMVAARTDKQVVLANIGETSLDNLKLKLRD